MGRSHLVALGSDAGGEWDDADANDSQNDDDDDDDDDDDGRKRRWWLCGVDGKETVFKERVAGDANVAVDAKDDAEDG